MSSVESEADKNDFQSSSSESRSSAQAEGEPKHTPGPWKWGKAQDCMLIIAPNAPYNYPPARVDWGISLAENNDYWIRDFEEQKANAQLISAAPELYQVVSKLVEQDPHDDLATEELLESAHGALAKARGQT